MENNVQTNKKRRETNPRQYACIISKLFFCWSLPLFVKGFKKSLSEDDLYQPLKAQRSKLLGDELEEAWRIEENNYRKPSLWRALIKVFWKEVAGYAVLTVIIEFGLKISQPLFIGKLLDYYKPNQTSISDNEAYMYATFIVSSIFLSIIINHSYMLGVQQLGMKIRVASCSLIYRKSLRLSKSALAETTIGQMVNLLSNDVSRFDSALIHFHNLWIAPLQTIIIIYLLYRNLGATSLMGITILSIFVPLQFYLGKRTSNFRLRTAIKTDQRVRLMNEIITGIQVIKMYTWERPFVKLVEQARKLEIEQIRGTSYIRAINVSFVTFLNRAAIFLCILTHVMTEHHLQAHYVYVLTAFYGVLRQSLTMFLPQGVTTLVECNVSIKRIENFLMYDEIDQGNAKTAIQYKKKTKETATLGVYSRMSQSRESENVGIHLHDATAKWNRAGADNTLIDVNFNVGSKQLVAVVGPVGSGKTSLLHVILKELPLVKGNLEIEGRISYASQEPWLFAGSIKQNICFGQSFDFRRYERVVKVCALERDFSLLPYGDNSIVGERGLMLSGGQKARINLARAIYKDADIYLLDDPLSAVDTHVGKQLFDDCISNYLKDKCTVLITHQIQYLRMVDRIHIMENGAIVASGTYRELLDSGTKITEIIESEPEKDDDLIDEQKAEFENGLLSNNSQEPREIKEQRGSGTVSGTVYNKYFHSGGTWCSLVLLLSAFIFSQLGSSGSDYFLAFWVNLEQERRSNSTQEMNQTANSTSERGSHWFFTTENFLIIYFILVMYLIIVTLLRSLYFFKCSIRASTKLHNSMFSKIVYAPMRFFNTNPSGRILNRFSKDMGAVDEILPFCVIDTLQIGLIVFSITIVVSLVNSWILLPTVIILTLFYCMRHVFLATSRNIKRMEGTTRSPVFTHLSASLQGLTTIRAFGSEDILKDEFDNHQDLHSSAYYMFIGCNRTFGFWLDMNCGIYIGLITFSFLLIGTETYGGNVGLAITQSVALTGMLQWGMRQWSELENQMTSVERVLDYTEIEPELTDDSKTPPHSWPEHGKIEFQSISLRYSLNDPFVLKTLNFVINPGEKVGIVGRTGAGKSSLIAVLFRLAPIEGNVLLDDVNTTDISLQSLRSKISIIPQDPVLFSGTLRKNLDPFEEFGDEVLWRALAEVEMKSAVADLPAGLSNEVSEGGSNFSMGQRQLLCLARAAIRNNKILVLDEATANVDHQTDELIQKTIRSKFKDCTVLTIAHRLHTVMDSDKILVMDAGQVVEFDHPHVLLQNNGGAFYGLVKQTGKAMAENLIKIAKQNYDATGP